tara:strand:+ start:1643 stop:1840 length:198 start_codon:yes stop_codon:yes gene_type:complete
MNDKIIVPDAAIREFNKKYGKYLPQFKKVVHAPVIDEDAMYLQAMGLSTDRMDSGFKSSKISDSY